MLWSCVLIALSLFETQSWLMSQMNLWSAQALLHNPLIHVCHLFQSCKWHFKALSKETTLLHGNKNKEISLLMLMHLVFTVVHRDTETLWSGGTTNLKQDGNILAYAFITANVSNYMVFNVIFYCGFIILSSTDVKKLKWLKNIQPITLIMQLFNMIFYCTELRLKN